MTAEEKMQLVDWLDDLCVRFIINLPQEELESVERICFQVEEAQWFYEDFIRPLDPSLPSMTLRNFCLRIFQHCPLLSAFSQYHHSAAFSEFLAYKTRVPVRGAILLNDTMDQVVLVKGWKKSAAWSFPRGKINKDERDLDCAIREVYEETGYDLRAAELVEDEEETKSIEVTMREQHMKLFIFRGIPMNTNFEPRTRKEISKIEWYKLSDLPTYRKIKQQHHDPSQEETKASKFYMVAPFLVPLKKWIGYQRKHDTLATKYRGQQTARTSIVEAVIEDGTAGETSAQEDEPIPAPSGDIGRLLSSLRGSNQPPISDSLPEVFDAPSPQQDAASELKRMLSVGAQPNLHQPSTQTLDASVNLLSILRGHPVTSYPPTSSALPPQTPAEQISEAPAEPRSLTHQHRSREPLIPALQPPSFSTASRSPSLPSTIQNEQSLQERLAALNNAVNQQNKVRSATNTAVDHNLRRESLGLRPAQVPPAAPKAQAEENLQQTPRPFQRAEDTNVPKWQPLGEVQSPPAPAANKLPLPKLNSHTLNLLNAFKGTTNAGPPLVSPIEASGSSSTRPSRKTTLEMNSSSLVGATSANGPGLTAPASQMLNSRSPAMTVSTPGSVANGHSSTSSMPENAKTVQQTTLLNLFRTPSISNSPAPGSPSPKQQLVSFEPVELSAAPNTPRVERQPGQVQILQRPKPVETAEAKSLDDPRQAQPPFQRIHKHIPSGQISATVSGPLTTPDFSTIQKRESQVPTAKPTAESGSPRGGLAVANPPNPRTRLSKLEPRRSEQPITTQEKKQDVQQPFHPRILQRPKPVQQTPASPAAASPRSPFDRRDSLPQDQKNNLLSLFSNSKTQSPVPATRSPLASPVDKQQVARHMSSSMFSQNRVGSVASVTSGGIGKSQSQIGSDSDRQTPVSPKDRDFLMGYLQGVVKGGK